MPPPRPARAVLLLGALAVLGGACASLERLDARATEQMLRAAGFEARAADTPERQHDLRSLPPRRIASRVESGTVVYTYADPDACRCVYVGGPREYAAYERLRRAASSTRGASPSGGAVGGAP